MKLFFAPLQGYTDCLYRRFHHQIVGGVDAYFSPFIRWERGVVRNKDLRDIHPENNVGVPLVPQVIASDVDELRPLLDWIQTLGYRRVDINMGCPFPLQTACGRGAALLVHPDRITRMMEELHSRPELEVSVKMRSGFETREEGLRTLEVLNGVPLSFVTIHPRLGKQQYKGVPDRKVFTVMMKHSVHPVVYNGDLRTVEDLQDVARQFPGLYGIMVGRGLLARPTLGKEWRQETQLEQKSRLRLTLAMHERLYNTALRMLQGEHQVLLRMHAFWEYQQPLVDKKSYKRLVKAGSLRNYEEAVRSLM